ncbi:myb/SANT-like DNA-binding domain-containing protein 2 isoform X2 [Protopterus annectens]|uniref:myb/SANT-like DNA-binding domain-containing protein 2 isoform X2 n=1 Tax=Protopterus annectens TaxID=7888 RepID=UPI001CFAFEE0|nr:myb/SANT-like DNA-binding domain-containing protein 2 isoform X2 [Protopterus annectens]
MAAPSNAELPSEPPFTLKTEHSSPSSPGLSDWNPVALSSPSPPGHHGLGQGIGTMGRGFGLGLGGGAASGSLPPFTSACRGMSWTPAETNALIAVWGNERLTEARYQQLDGSGTVFSSKAPGPAMYERVSRALAELGYERTPSQCRERIKTLRRCYSRVKEHGLGKRKSSYTFEQLEQVFGQGGWEPQPCQPVLINSSGLYQEMESDGSTMEDYSQDEWGNHNQELRGCTETDQEIEEISLMKKKLHPRRESSEDIQNVDQEKQSEQRIANRMQEMMQNVVRILEAVQLKWEQFQSWTDFSRLHLSNKLAIFGVGYNTRWKDDVRYYYAEISSQVPLGKRLREYFNPEKPEGRLVMTKVQKMNWKNVYYKYLEITISEARCLELHMVVDWIPIAHSRAAGGNVVHYLLPGGIPKSPGLYAVGYEEPEVEPRSPRMECGGRILSRSSLRSDSSSPSGNSTVKVESENLVDHLPKIHYCYLGIAEDRTLQQCLFQHFQSSSKSQGGINGFLAENCNVQQGTSPKSIYIKFVEVERDFLSAGSLVECLEKAVGYPLKFNL